jgi:hypothetical protein
MSRVIGRIWPLNSRTRKNELVVSGFPVSRATARFAVHAGRGRPAGATPVQVATPRQLLTRAANPVDFR